jgi:hypothetical protein
LAIAAAVEPVAVRSAGAGLDRRGAAEHGEGGFGAERFGVVAGGDEECAGRVGADAESADQLWRGGRGESGELAVEAADLGLERLAATGEVPERELAGGERRVELAGAELGGLADKPRGRERSQLVSHPGGAVTSSARRALIACVRALSALPRARRSSRIISTSSSPAFGEPAASADKTARAAASASVGSDLPLRRRVWRLGRITSTTRISRARRWRASAAP